MSTIRDSAPRYGAPRGRTWRGSGGRGQSSPAARTRPVDQLEVVFARRAGVRDRKSKLRRRTAQGVVGFHRPVPVAPVTRRLLREALAVAFGTLPATAVRYSAARCQWHCSGEQAFKVTFGQLQQNFSSSMPGMGRKVALPGWVLLPLWIIRLLLRFRARCRSQRISTGYRAVAGQSCAVVDRALDHDCAGAATSEQGGGALAGRPAQAGVVELEGRFAPGRSHAARAVRCRYGAIRWSA